MITSKFHRRKLYGKRCIYCGEPARERDHFPPQASGRVTGWLLPACVECNRLARHWFGDAFAERWRYVQDQIRQRGRNRKCRDLERLNARLAWNAVDYLQNIDPSNDFVLWCVAEGIFTNNAKLNLSIYEMSHKEID
jgi:hypothetical protein